MAATWNAKTPATPHVVEVYTHRAWFANDYPATTVAHAVAIALREVGLTTSTTDAR